MKHVKIFLIGEHSEMEKQIHLATSSNFQIKPFSFTNRSKLRNAALQNSIAIILQSRKDENGLNKLSILKTEYPSLPILLIAKKLDPEEIIMAFKVGANDVLITPFPTEKLISSLHQLSNLKPNDISFWKKAINYCSMQLNFFWKNLHKKQLTLVDDSNHFQSTILPIPTVINFDQQKEQLTPDIHVQFFGKLNIHIVGKRIQNYPGKKTTSLLAYLLFHLKRRINKEVLMDTFWPDSPPTSARNSLNVIIHHIRKLFKKDLPDKEFIIYSDGCYSINPDLIIEKDVDAFSSYWHLGRNKFQTSGLEAAVNEYQKAAELYQADFLEEFRYEEWTQLERENFKETYLVMMNGLCQHFYSMGDLNQTINLGRKMLEQDNCLEEIHRLLISCYERLDMRDRAIRQFFKCKKALAEELEVPPSPSTMELYEKLRT